MLPKGVLANQRGTFVGRLVAPPYLQDANLAENLALFRNLAGLKTLNMKPRRAIVVPRMWRSLYIRKSGKCEVALPTVRLASGVY